MMIKKFSRLQCAHFLTLFSLSSLEADWPIEAEEHIDRVIAEVVIESAVKVEEGGVEDCGMVVSRSILDGPAD